MQTYSITPNQDALAQIAKQIWAIAAASDARPLVILPTAGPNLSLRLALESSRPSNTMLLPEVHSLADWLALTPDGLRLPQPQSNTERVLQTYASIETYPNLREWFTAEGEGGAWSLANAIVSACDLLSQSVVPQLAWSIDHLELEHGIEQVQIKLSQAIADAYPQLAQELVSKESAVLLAFWRYLSSVRDPVITQHLALVSHLQQWQINPKTRRPLIWIETIEENDAQARAHQAFLDHCEAFIPVHRFVIDWTEVGLWPETMEFDASLDGQLQINRSALNQKHITCQSAKRFEDLAWEATHCIEGHLQAGRTQIALVAQDRLLARRTRALLARLGPGLSIDDETGWKLSTTRAAAALHAWLELLRCPPQGPSAITLLEFLKNPFLNLSGLLNATPEEIGLLISELESMLLLKQARASWVSFYLAIEAGASSEFDPRLHHLLQSIRERVSIWQNPKMQNLPSARALAQLRDDLSYFGMRQQFEEDAAGLQLLAMLDKLGLEQAQLPTLRMPLAEWIIFLKTRMEEEVYREQGSDASARVTILPLSATRLRRFDAVVMVGCDERQLPSYGETPLFFTESLSQTLGGTDIARQYRQQARDLSQLFASYSYIDLLWLSEGASGEPLRASPWIVRLQEDLPQLATRESSRFARSAVGTPMTMAQANRLDGLPMPTRMSPSAYRALRACPYQYYVRSLLGLRKRKDLDDELDASVIGQTLHQILRNFFQELKSTEARDAQINDDLQFRKDWMITRLMRASEQGFSRLLEGDQRVLGHLRDWQKQIPSFVEWQLERESQGWRFHDAERKLSFEFNFLDKHGQFHQIQIEGYADRIDVKPNTASLAILDYKHQSREKVLERGTQLMDDPQLLLYAKALSPQGPIEQLDWVSLRMNLKKKGTDQRAVGITEIPLAMQQLDAQLQNDLRSVWSGDAMQAFAPESTCRYCDARGICRKGMW
ncbi:PD-(D/E)XK nuclease family protein [Polynucleobacter sp. HIN7]|uniref:PD-(D/E)XK nuclease family protein n=1 Tax=Polynucleobacter sp. HIN7 TaxID=3047866 RepID=UPI0025744EC4|nr:PD-(D/E)XK nuclease family protein [Polynucleobacter sp. HIN7]BEI37119.1 hypothetical protein PHIN7_08430 [Polynucleobacter sp. HIN7]